MTDSKSDATRRTRVAAGVASPARARQIASGIGTITSYVAAGGAAPGMQELVDNIDFPQFVAALIEGTFNAAVHASIEQMEAYAQLVKDVARTVDQFAEDNLSAEQARDWLVSKYPELIDDGHDDDDDDSKKRARLRRRRLPQKERRQLVARAMLIGINRIVVTSGRIGAKKKAAGIRRRR
jgi:hypothetical protein